MHTRRKRWGESAAVFLTFGQQLYYGILVVLFLVYLSLAGFHAALKLVVALITVFYVVFVGMKVLVSIAGMSARVIPQPVPSVDDPTLPFYTIIVSAYKETLPTLRRLVENLGRLQYPTDRLQIILALEEDDTETQQNVAQLNLPAHFIVDLSPNVGPRTKPKACNHAMIRVPDARPEIRDRRLVLLDVEDRVAPDFLLRGVGSLNAAHRRDSRVVCVQGKLKFWNPRSGKPAPFYWAEYIVHFMMMLRGFSRLGLIPPLGGTSNHFFEWALWEVEKRYKPITGGHVRIPSIWDSYNITEDADLAARLARLGYRIVMDGSVTLEEAPSNLKVARAQRSRWLAGYGITGLVHTRRPFSSMVEMGPVRWFTFNLFMLGTPVSLVLNPIMWTTTAMYVTFRLTGWTAGVNYMESLFANPWIYYAGMLTAVVGNGFLFYQKLVTPLKEREYGLAKYLLLSLVWWAFTSYIAYRAVFEMINPRTRYRWHKTPHGHDAALEDQAIQQALDAGHPVDASTFTAAPQGRHSERVTKR